jgi:hypothetical protein
MGKFPRATMRIAPNDPKKFLGLGAYRVFRLFVGSDCRSRHQVPVVAKPGGYFVKVNPAETAAICGESSRHDHLTRIERGVIRSECPCSTG